MQVSLEILGDSWHASMQVQFSLGTKHMFLDITTLDEPVPHITSRAAHIINIYNVFFRLNALLDVLRQFESSSHFEYINGNAATVSPARVGVQSASIG
jgi:hypothetical protein